MYEVERTLSTYRRYVSHRDASPLRLHMALHPSRGIGTAGLLAVLDCGRQALCLDFRRDAHFINSNCLQARVSL